MIEIKHTTLQDVMASPELARLLDAYAQECSLPEIGSPKPDFSVYEMLESAGAAVFVTAHDYDQLVGFAVLLVTQNPHYGKRVGVVESLFLDVDYRSGDNGRRLVGYVETMAAHMGAEALLVSAPVGGALAKVAPRWGFRETNQVFAKVIE